VFVVETSKFLFKGQRFTYFAIISSLALSTVACSVYGDNPTDNGRGAGGSGGSAGIGVSGGADGIVRDASTTSGSGGVLTGPAASIYVPGHGAYYFSLEASPGFQEIGHASRDRLSFSLDGEDVEIAASQNVLKHSSYRPVWVKHDPSIKSKENRIQVMSASKVEWLVPKKR
jgi:hypothetical protein